jgi:hypothetical protein
MFGLKNERTVIQFDNEKGRKMDFLRRLFIAAIIAAVALTFYLPGKYLMSQAQSTRLNSTLFGLILGCGGLMRHYIKVMEKENSGLVLSSQGIVFNGTELGQGLGLVAWEDIEAVDRGDGECVYLRLKNPEKYSGRAGGEERILKEGVEIRAEGLRTGFKGMEGDIRRYFESRRQS